MDKHVTPSGLAELEQLYVEPNSEHSTSSHHSSTHCRQSKLGGGVQASEAIRACCARATTCRVEQWTWLTSQFHTQTHTIYILTSMWSDHTYACRCEAWCRISIMCAGSFRQNSFQTVEHEALGKDWTTEIPSCQCIWQKEWEYMRYGT